MHAADEDLPALAWLCNGYLQQFGEQMPRHDTLLDRWPTFIQGNDPQLYRELAKGYGCLHLHLSGSYPAPYYWVGLMNKRFNEDELASRADSSLLRGYRTIEDIALIVRLIKLAQVARYKLFEFVKHRTNDALLMNRDKVDCQFLFSKDTVFSFRKDNKTDYAQEDVPLWNEAISPSLAGERYLLFRVFRCIELVSNDEIAEQLARLLWAYIVAKHAFLSTVQQAEGTAGFDYFEHTFRLVKWKVPGQETSCAEEIGNFLQESGSLVKLELMTAPRDEPTGYAAEINIAETIQKRLADRLRPSLREKYGEPKVGLIVHFIKDVGEPLSTRLTSDKNAYLAYHHVVRDRIASQFDALRQYLGSQRNEGRVVICGIDAANREIYCPPEVFAEVFRRAVPELRRLTGKRLTTIGRTFHVGEDFAHIVTGIRRVYEALTFLELRPGDRLGHACALGLDPVRWSMMNPSVEMHLIDILDDAVFEAILLRSQRHRKGELDENRMSELMRTIDECCVEIFGSTISLVHLEKAWRLRAKASRNGAADFSSDQSVPQWVQNQHKLHIGQKYDFAGSHSLVMQIRDIANADEIVPADTAERISIEYLHDIRTIQRFLKIRTIDTSHAVKSFVNLQNLVIEEANSRGIVIESNPSSNWLISGLESHSEIPAVRWLTQQNERQDGVAFTINPDDPTVFANSIENEYFMVFSAAVHSARALSRVECLREIAILRERSLQASFLD